MRRLLALCLLLSVRLAADVSPTAELSAVTTAATAPVAASAWPDKIKLSGFLKAWAVAADTPSKDYRAGSLVVRNLRLKVEAKPDPRVKVVFMPEFAGSTITPLTLLDAYISLQRGPLELTAGQFYAPFGQDATTSAAKLWSADYALLYKALKPGNGGNARDEGLMATVKAGSATLQAATLMGLGINKASANGYVTDRNDSAAKLELALPEHGTVFGVGAYGGWAGLAQDPTWWTEAHVRAENCPSLPALFAKLEWMNRADTGAWGATANAGLKLGRYRHTLIYERLETVAHAGGKTVLGAAITRDMGAGLSLGLNVYGEATGPSVSPTGGRGIAQLLAEF
jgi:hypothetical protein